nr:MAG TPA: hypothetical protein [Caudoviricetes sp.]
MTLKKKSLTRVYHKKVVLRNQFLMLLLGSKFVLVIT